MARMRYQPQTRPRIDWSNPLTMGLTFAYLPGIAKDVTENFKQVQTNGGTTRLGGSVIVSGAYRNGLKLGTGPLLGNKNNSTVLAIGTFPQGYRAIYVERGENGNAIYKLESGFSGRTGVNFTYRNDNGDLLFTSLDAPLNDGRRAFALSKSGSTHTVFTGLVGKRDGQTSSQTFNGPTNFTEPSIERALGYDVADDNQPLIGTSELLLGWSRTLSTAEMQSLQADPWQIFLVPEPEELDEFTLNMYFDSQGVSSSASSTTAMAQAIRNVYGLSTSSGAANSVTMSVNNSAASSNSSTSVVGKSNSVYQAYGSSSGYSTADAATVTIYQSSGNASGTSSSTCAVNIVRETVGVSNSSSNALNQTQSVVVSTAVAVGSSSADSRVQVVFSVNGISQGSSTFSGNAASVWQVVGTSSGLGNVRGRSVPEAGKDSYMDVAATSFGSSSAYAVTQTIFETAGSSFGNSVVSGLGQTLTNAIAKALATSSTDGRGVSVVSATGVSISASLVQTKSNTVFASSGNSQSISIVDAATIIIYESVAKSVGANSVQAVVQSVARTFGNSVGKSTISGVTEGGAHYTAYGDKFNVTILFAPYRVEVDSNPYKVNFN